MRGDLRAFAVIGAAGALDVAAILLLGALPHAGGFLASGLLHVTAAVAVLRLRGAEPTRRLLAAAMIFSLPLIGVAMAALVVSLRGRGNSELLTRSAPVPRAGAGAELARRLTAGGPACEALLASDAEARHAAMSSLQRDADARAITLLRWALAQPAPELALEAALALEELSARYAERSAEACAEAERRPSRDSALAAAEVIASAIYNGLADPALLPVIAAQARDYYRMAARLDEPRAGELACARARLELAMLDPGAALALLEPVLAANAGDARLLELYRDAAHAARRFELLAAAEPRPAATRLTPTAYLLPTAHLTPVALLVPAARQDREAHQDGKAHDRPKPREGGPP
jgi:hypothetical protein